jgi:hypothetical protein
MSPDAFWDSTPGELGLFLKAARLRLRDETDLVTIGAYRQVAFSWRKRLPPLDEILRHAEDEADGQVSLTPEQRKAFADRQLRLWDQFYARHGVKPTVH